MKIAFVIPRLHKRGGTERCVAMLVEHMARQGHEVTVFSSHVEDLKAPIRWVRVPRMPGPGVIPFLSFWIANACVRWARRVWMRESFDILHSTGPDVPNPDVVTFHCLHRDFLALERQKERIYGGGVRQTVRRWSHMLLAWVAMRLEDRLLRNPRVKAFVCLSQRMKRAMDETPGATPERVVVIPDGVDPHSFNPAVAVERERFREARQIASNESVILFVGNTWERKGLSTLLEACGGLAGSVCVLVVGQGDERLYAERASALGCRRVLFEGSKQPIPDMAPYYGGADIFALPTRVEPFGLPVLEAMACGLPVIVSETAGVAELMTDSKDGVLLKNPMDASDLREKLEFLIAHPEARQKMGHAAADKAQAYTWERIGRQTQELYEKV